jgi:hypothetical protein
MDGEQENAGPARQKASADEGRLAAFKQALEDAARTCHVVEFVKHTKQVVIQL